MGLFTKREKAEIAALKDASVAETVSHFTELHEAKAAAKSERDRLMEQIARQEAAREALARSHELTVQLYEGKLSEAHITAERYGVVMFGHRLKIPGRKMVHGVNLMEYACDCGFRVYAEEGFFKVESS